jgi:hypothetical protein
MTTSKAQLGHAERTENFLVCGVEPHVDFGDCDGTAMWRCWKKEAFCLLLSQVGSCAYSGLMHDRSASVGKGKGASFTAMLQKQLWQRGLSHVWTIRSHDQIEE